MSLNCKKLYEFGPYRLDAQKRQLWRGGEPVPLTAKAAEILIALVGRGGEIVSKDELMQALWPDSFVEEANLTQNVFLLRKGLGESAQDRNYIVTVPGKGYCFGGEVRELEREGSVAVATATPAPAPAPEEVPVTVTPPAPPVRRTWKLWAAAAALLMVAALGYMGWRTQHRPQPMAGHRLVLAVLPFANLTGDAGQDYFIDGLTAEIIVRLGRLDPEHLGVISRSSVMGYKEGQKQVERIARELGVEYVLEGSVRRDSNQVRVTSELVQVKDQTHVWAREYDRQLTSQFALQGEIAQEVVDEIELKLGHPKPVAGGHASDRRRETSEARDLYVKGRYFWNKRTEPAFGQAVDYFQQAIAQDSKYAPAYSGLADCYMLMVTYNVVPAKEFIAKARTAALRSLEINPNLAEGHNSLALIAEIDDWDWQTAEKEFRRSIELDPDYSTAHQWYAEYLGFQGRYEEALAESERALHLDPLSLIIATDHGAIELYARHYDRAIERLRSVLEMEPNFPRARGLLINAYVNQRRFSQALNEIGTWRQAQNDGWVWANEAYIYGRMGKTEKALLALHKFEELSRQHSWNSGPMQAIVYAATDKEKALALLEKAYAERSSAVITIKADPAFDPLRSDPRFQDLLRRMGLPQ